MALYMRMNAFKIKQQAKIKKDKKYRDGINGFYSQDFIRDGFARGHWKTPLSVGSLIHSNVSA